MSTREENNLRSVRRGRGRSFHIWCRPPSLVHWSVRPEDSLVGGTTELDLQRAAASQGLDCTATMHAHFELNRDNPGQPAVSQYHRLCVTSSSRDAATFHTSMTGTCGPTGAVCGFVSLPDIDHISMYMCFTCPSSRVKSSAINVFRILCANVIMSMPP